MARAPAPPASEWDTVRHRGREFAAFPLRVKGDREVRCTVPWRIAERYEIRGVLARGGGGMILEALDRRTGRDVLVKALAEYHLDREDLDEPIEEVVEIVRRARHHLQTERRLLVRLRNAGCAAVPLPHDYVCDVNPGLVGPHRTRRDEPWRFNEPELVDSEPFLVLQRVAGSNLEDLLADEYPEGIDEATALRIVDQVAAVLEQLHRPWTLANGRSWRVVYQDLKPGNILVDRTGRATLIDFGGCQIEIDDTLVLQGSYTPGYAAPECGERHVAVGPQADCYALASTAYHLLTGANPRRLHAARTAPDDSPALRFDLRPLRPDVAPATYELLRDALDWEPAQRPASATEFRRRLAPLL